MMPEVSQTPKETKMYFNVIWGLLQLEFPTTLGRSPSADAFMLPNLMVQRRGGNLGRDALHPVWLFQARVDQVETVIVRLKIQITDVGPFARHNKLLESHQSSCVSLALERGRSKKIGIYAGDHGINLED